jgi:pimeloyl-ACP methyl ester carboxylesterase
MLSTNDAADLEGTTMSSHESDTGTRFVKSKDGTRIAYNQAGRGPTLVLVSGALGFRGMSFAKQYAREFAKHFTIVDYDRRGRGESGDVSPYAIEREIEDLAAVIEAAGPCYVFAQSSGAALALKAAAAGVPMKALVAYEPPYMVGNPPDRPAADYSKRVTALIADGKRDEAVKLFMVTVGVPRFAVAIMRLFPFWKHMRTVAHTLPYDAAIMGTFDLPVAELESIRVPVVAVAGEKTTPTLKRAVQAVAETIPGAQHRVAPKMSHAIKAAVLAPLLRSWLEAVR